MVIHAGRDQLQRAQQIQQRVQVVDVLLPEDAVLFGRGVQARLVEVAHVEDMRLHQVIRQQLAHDLEVVQAHVAEPNDADVHGPALLLGNSTFQQPLVTEDS